MLGGTLRSTTIRGRTTTRKQTRGCAMQRDVSCHVVHSLIPDTKAAGVIASGPVREISK